MYNIGLKNSLGGIEMAEVRNCPTCNELFNYTGIRDVCHACANAEEDMYQIVYRFLRKRENRAATIDRIVEATGVTEELIHKWVRKKRLQPAMFPNLGYPCDQCGHLTYGAKLCDRCSNNLKKELKQLQAAEDFRESVRQADRGTYLSQNRK